MALKSSKIHSIRLIIIIGSLLLFMSFNGRLHLFDWDEINFAESAREMIVTGDYSTVQINFQPFWEKPPLFIWMQALSMKIFGINEFAARFPNAICGVITLLFLFEAGRRRFGFRFGWLWALAYAGSFLPFFYFKSGIIDPWFNLFIYGSLYTLYLYTDDSFKGNKQLTVSIGGVLLGLAILTKGPAAIVIMGLAFGVYLLVRRFRVAIKLWDVGMFALATLLTGGSWFIFQLLTGNLQVIIDFIEYQIRLFSTPDAGHRGFLLYHFVVLLIGVFPASVFLFPSKKQIKSLQNTEYHYFLWNLVLLSVVLVLFTIVKTKIVHYSSLVYFPATFIAALFIEKMITSGKSFSRWQNILAGFIAVFYVLLVIILPLTDILKPYFIEKNLINDPFALANLQADGNWKLWEGLTGLILIGGLIAFIRLNQRKLVTKAVVSLFLANIIYIYSSLVLIVPNIEAYSQRAVIEFCKTVGENNDYVHTVGFKSYAVYFYAQRQPPGLPIDFDLNDPKEIPGSRNLYIIMKNAKKEKYLQEYPRLEYLYEKNGFVFTKLNAIENYSNIAP
jgi:4-amino-4-deoxy-L-arabinose transferase-like glycosyltransferase